MIRVVFLTRTGAQRGSSRVRVHQFLPHLDAAGFEARVLEGPRRGASRTAVAVYMAHALQAARWADVVLLQKPFQPLWLVRSIRSINRRLIVDLDDAVWAPPPESDDPETRRRHEVAGRRVAETIRQAGVAIVGSGYLGNWVASQCPDAEIVHIPPAVDLARAGSCSFRAGNSEVVVGWIGSPGNMRDLQVLDGELGEMFHQRGLRFVVISDRSPRLRVLEPHLMPWDSATEWDTLRALDIGVMPFTDDERSRGRCGYKALQYMAVGLPVVASDVGVTRDIVEDGVTGFVVNGSAGWREAIARLARDPHLRQRMGERGRITVANHFSIPVLAPRLIEALRARAS